MATIGVVDSGIGGLAIAAAIMDALPKARVVYCADQANFPYGPKPAEEVVRAVDQATTKLMDKEQVDILVIACNTASTVVLPFLRAKHRIPIVGVVPAIKPAAESSRSRAIALLATPSTAHNPYSSNLIAEFASDCRVVRLGTARLVEIAEEKMRGITPKMPELHQIVAPLFKHAEGESLVDFVVLGCTHFSSLVDELVAVSPSGTSFIDSTIAVSRRVVELVATLAIDRDNAKIMQHQFYITAPMQFTANYMQAIQRYGFHDIVVLLSQT